MGSHVLNQGSTYSSTNIFMLVLSVSVIDNMKRKVIYLKAWISIYTS
jgi:hypothetical protein